MKIPRILTGTPASLSLIGIAAALWVWQAPAELTLGDGIKIVYLHVAATWTGMSGLLIASAVGAGILLTGRRVWVRIAQSAGWTGLAFFGGGLLLSMVAAQVNWGGVGLSEPRMASSLQVGALGLIVQILGGWPVPVRLKGFLWVALGLGAIGSVVFTPVELHPQNPIQTSSSPAIQLAFFGLYVLFMLAGVQIIRTLYALPLSEAADRE